MATSAAGRTAAHDATVSPGLRPHGDDHGTGAWLLSGRLRSAFLVWAVLSLPVVAVVAHFAGTPSRYLVVFALLASGFYTTPALVNTWLAARRSGAPDACCWWLWHGCTAAAWRRSISCCAPCGARPRWRSSITWNITA